MYILLVLRASIDKRLQYLYIVYREPKYNLSVVYWLIYAHNTDSNIMKHGKKVVNLLLYLINTKTIYYI